MAAVCAIGFQGAPGAAGAESWTDDDFADVSGPASPRVAYGVRLDGDQLQLQVDVADLDSTPAGTVQVGLSAAKTVTLDASKGAPVHRPGATRYTFTIPAAALAAAPADWDKLRFALAVSWPGGPFGLDRQRECFLQSGTAPAAGLSPDPARWSPLDLKGNAADVSNRKKRIFVDFAQPLDGKSTIVIEDAQGRRVRNLVSGQPFPKGPQRVEWDGTDEQGNVVPAGAYQWRALSHPGIVPHYLFSFYNEGKPPWRNGSPSSNWLADHSNAVAAAAYGDRVYLGCPVAESGGNVVQLDLAGNKTGGLNFPTLVGIGKLFMAADDKYFYAIMEGKPAYEPLQPNPNGSGWTFRRPLNIMRWDPTSKVIPYDGPRGEKVVTLNLFTGEGAIPNPDDRVRTNAIVRPIPQPDNLNGVALLDGTFYVSLRQDNKIAVVSAADGATETEIKVDQPGLVGTDGKGLLVAFSGNKLVQIDPASKAVTPLFTPVLSALPTVGDPEQAGYGFVGKNPTGIAVSPAGEIYLSDNGADQNIKVFNLQGKLLREIGKKGGRPLNGTWDPGTVARPHGIALDSEGKLWVAETEAYPRRNSAWDGKTGKLVKELYGPNPYGAPGGGFDSEDHTRWVGAGAQWKLDFDKHAAVAVSSLYHPTKPGQPFPEFLGHYLNFYHKDGRTFLLGYGEGQPVYELMKDGSAKLWAFCGPITQISQNPRWTLPRSLVDLPAVDALFKENAAANHNPPLDMAYTPFGQWKDRVEFNEALMHNATNQGTVSVLWVDKNGDGIAQPDEYEALPSGDSFQVSVWGTGNPTLDLKIPAKIGGKPVLLTLKADGFLPSGAPNYSLAKAVASAVEVEPGTVGAESIQDRFGRELFNSTPMKGIGPDGKTLWTFPNRWVGVHGSHEAPLPKSGEMQGVLYYLGTAPLDDKAEVTVMNGNHGRFFVMTTDGFYVDEMFKDVRVTQEADAYLIGGECFGGFFAKCEDGKYYLQSGHTDFRIFQIDGLDKIQRSQGPLNVTPAQVIAAQGNLATRAAKVQAAKFADITEVPAAQKMGDPRQWPGPVAATWGDGHMPYPYVEVRAVRQGANLLLNYHVKDPSPWVNKGNDWTLLFKSGDCVDFQFGCNPDAKPERGEAVVGDKRLLIAPFQDHPIAVLYSYHEPGAKNPVSFSSPARTERVDRVAEIKSAQITVKPDVGSYDVVVSVPLAELGLPADGKELKIKGDFGVIYGDEAGSMDLLRSYWSNQATGLVNDVPGETTVAPKLWGTLQFHGAPAAP